MEMRSWKADNVVIKVQITTHACYLFHLLPCYDMVRYEFAKGGVIEYYRAARRESRWLDTDDYTPYQQATFSPDYSPWRAVQDVNKKPLSDLETTAIWKGYPIHNKTADEEMCLNKRLHSTQSIGCIVPAAYELEWNLITPFIGINYHCGTT